MLLLDGLLIGFRKIPFACTYYPGRSRAATLWPFYIVALVIYAYALSAVERAAMTSGDALGVIVAAVAAVYAALASMRRRERQCPLHLIYEEEEPDRTFEGFNLSEGLAAERSVSRVSGSTRRAPRKSTEPLRRSAPFQGAAMRKVLRGLWFVLRRRQLEADLAQEMAVHREMAEQEFVRLGASLADARREADRRLGSATLVHDLYRDARMPLALRDITSDVRVAVRLLTKDRGLTLAAVMTLALGIGSAGTIFTIFDGMFLKGLPVDRPDRIVTVGALDHQGRPLRLSPPAFDDWRTATDPVRSCGCSHAARLSCSRSVARPVRSAPSPARV